jgi:uncharacterized membrane protein
MAPREPGWPLRWLSAPLRRGHTRGAIGSLRVKMKRGRPTHAFSWTKQTGMIDLGALDAPNGGRSVATAVNQAGQVAGWSEDDQGNLHAVIWHIG